MKKRNIVVSSIMALACAVIMPAQAMAATAAPPSDADYLEEIEEIEEIAGRPAPYSPTPVDESSMARGVSTMAITPFNCTLYPSVVHLRASGGYGTVGAKPYMQCTAGTPSHIQMTSTLYIVEWGGLSYREMMTRSSQNWNSARLEQKNMDWPCVNSNNSVFQQKTNGTTVENGTNYYSLTWTSQVTLGCGY